MIPDLLSNVMRRISDEYPDLVVIALEHADEDLPSVTHFVHILNVPTESLVTVTDRGWDLAYEVYGDASMPLLLTSINVESSAKHYAKHLGSAKDDWLGYGDVIAAKDASYWSVAQPAGSPWSSTSNVELESFSQEIKVSTVARANLAVEESLPLILSSRPLAA